MSNLQYYAYPGMGPVLRKNHSYSQAVRVGDRIECSGQGLVTLVFRLELPKYVNLRAYYLAGGWDPQTGEMKTGIYEEIDQAFKNVDLNLRDAGGKGFSQVFRVNSYHKILNDDVLERMNVNFKKWMPDHQPLFTCVGVPQLAREGMNVEIEVSAYDEEGAEAAKKTTSATVSK